MKNLRHQDIAAMSALTSIPPPSARVQVWFEISLHGRFRQDLHIAASAFVMDSETVQGALTQVCTQRSASSFEFHGQQLLIEHCLNNEETVRIEVFSQGAMIRIAWHSTIRNFTNRTFYINFEDVTGVDFNVQELPESP